MAAIKRNSFFNIAKQAFVACLLMLFAQLSIAAPPSDLERARIATVLPQVNKISEPEGQFGVRTLMQNDELVGYAFESINVINIPAYSGKPMNMQVVLDLEGRILDA